MAEDDGDEAAASEEDFSAQDDEAKPAPQPVPDVGAARAALDAVVKLKGHLDVENKLLSEHLMVLSSSSSSSSSLHLEFYGQRKMCVKCCAWKHGLTHSPATLLLT
jgi:hypothetical protein